MANNRLEFQALLEKLLGSTNVYFQPPSTLMMKYPAIVYKKEPIESVYADDLPYGLNTKYSVTYIDADPDSDMPMKLAKLRYSACAQTYTSDNLNHTVFTIYY